MEQTGTSQASPDLKPGNVSDILDRRNESRRYVQVNYWDQWEEVYRASKCRTKPIMVKDKSGNEVEDQSRTNVAMPEMSLIIRRKTARLTANPPQINYTCAQDSDQDKLADRLTAWSYQQFDKSGEAQEHRRLVLSGQTFGYGVMKQYWDTVEVTRKFYRSLVKGGQPFSMNRTGLMSMQDAPDDEISGAVKERGENLGEGEINEALAKYGPSVQVPVRASQFEGPVSKNVFVGDFFMEPGCASLNTSGWAIENYWEGDVWIKKMLAKRWMDEDGKEQPVFDPKAVRELEELPSWQPVYQQQPFDLRSRLRTNAMGQTLPLWPTKLLKGKRYDILECHTKDSEGKFWIEWVGNEKVFLGRMAYPWDLYGKYAYTELVPMFDLLSAYGDSTPQLLRHVWLLHNAIVGSRRDLVANMLRPLLKAKVNADIPDEVIDRALYRVIMMRNPGDLEPLIDNVNNAAAIQAATEEEAQNLRMMALAEPNLTNVETGTEANPQAGKTATTAVLAAKSADALTQFELDSMNWYLKEAYEKKLAMLQQIEPETDDQSNSGYKPYQIASEYAGKVDGLTQSQGKASVASLDFMEIQQEIQVKPAAMSMLSVDDDIRRTGSLQLLEMAGQMPGVVDPYYAARNFAATIKGVDVDKAIPPPKPPQPPPPKVGLNITAKLPELTPSERLSVMGSGIGVQATPEEMQHLQVDETLKGIGKLSEAANHADNLTSTKSVDDMPETPQSKGVNDPPSAKNR
jgi:hypothetical protein